MEISEYFRNTVNRPRVDFFHILAVSPIPGLIIDGDIPVLQDSDDLPDVNFPDDPPQFGRLHIILGDHNGHSIFQNSEDEKDLFFTRNLLGLNGFNDSNTVSWVNR